MTGDNEVEEARSTTAESDDTEVGRGLPFSLVHDQHQ
jgi:hypothetical protein